MKKTSVNLQLAILLLVYTPVLFSQKPQLSLKLGAVKTFAAPFKISEGYAYRNYSEIYPYPTIAIEYSKGPKRTFDVIFCGISLQPVIYNGGFNYKSVRPDAAARQFGVGSLSLQFYSGIEKRVYKRITPQNKNFFSWTTGIGLNINGPFGKNGYHHISTLDDGTTYDGRQIAGSDLYFKDAQFFIAPSIFAGLRYHLRNKKGKQLFVIELIANYGITRYFNYALQYQIDGQPAEDRLGEKGLNIQLNIKIPLKSFGRTKRF